MKTILLILFICSLSSGYCKFTPAEMILTADYIFIGVLATVLTFQLTHNHGIERRNMLFISVLVGLTTGTVVFNF